MIAVLVVFDEDPVMLEQSVASWSKICDGLVAVDGAFTEYPGTAVLSPPVQVDAILQTAERYGMSVTLHRPRARMTQVAKRSLAFALADAAAKQDEWLLWVDADEQIPSYPEEIHEALCATSRDVAEVTVNIEGSYLVQQRRLVRAGLGVRCEGYHWRYVTADGRVLWDEPHEPQEDALATSLRLMHRRDMRPPARIAAQEAYYAERVERVERLA